MREAVIGDQAKQLNLVDAYLIGYKLYRVKNTNYPLIVKEKSSSNKINGLIATGLDKQVIRKLDMFEGKNYSRSEVSVFRNTDNEENYGRNIHAEKKLCNILKNGHTKIGINIRGNFFHDDLEKEGTFSWLMINRSYGSRHGR